MSKNKNNVLLIFATNRYQMKRALFLLTCSLFIFCSRKEHEIIGLWTVKSNYYKATYKISLDENNLTGKVMYYNDGTTILRETKTDKDIFLFNLEETNNHTYIEAISGATETKNQTTSIKIKHKDTLEVTSYIMKTPLIETWIRIHNNNTYE